MKPEYTKLLQLLGAYSEKVYSGTLTDNDYVDFQRIESRIIEAYKNGKFDNEEYRSLARAYYHIKAAARAVLRLDPKESA